MIIPHKVSRLGFGLIEFEGGAAVEVNPPPELSVGDEVIVHVLGLFRRTIDWLIWTDQKGKRHFIRYDIHGNPH
jgi:hypothetical protein